MRRIVAALGTGGIIAFALIASRGQPDGPKPPVPSKLPAAIGAIHPRLSPDGASIAFSFQGAIWTAPRASGTMTLLTTGEGDDTEPAWSPDGKRIAYVRGGAVKLSELDGTDVPLPKALVTAGTYGANKLEFSADGKRLLGTFRTDGQDRGLAWYDLATGAVQPLAAIHFYSRFALSPDGNWIALTKPPDRPGEQSGNNGSYTEVLKLPAAGGKSETVCRFPARIHEMCWADGGRSLVVAAELGQAHDDLWKLPLDDPLRGMTKLTAGQADEDRPSVSRDGKWLAYADNRDGATAIVVRNATTGEESTVRFDAMDHRRPTGTLRLRVVDAATKKPVVARLSLKEDRGKYHAPPGSLHRSLRGVPHFYCDGSTELTVPTGTYKLKGFRGPEYRVAPREIAVEAGKTTEVTVELERWVHMAAAGWWSGELHIHANYGYGTWFNSPATMLRQCAGEDLNVCNFVVANSDADVVYDRPFFRGGPDPLSTPETLLYWNQEFRSTVWGHMTFVNLKQVVEPVFTGFEGTTNPWDWPSNAEVAERVRWQKGVVNYTHVSQGEDWSKTPYAAKAIPIDAALGRVDTLDINNSWAASVPLWYRLLNCGFRIPATAGTDVFLNRIGSNLPGGDRVYVRHDGPLDYAKWIDGLKVGRSFVSSGPMLEFTVDGSEPGRVLKLGEKPKVRVKATARSQFPLAKADVVHNGTVVASAALSDDKLTATLDKELALDRGGWLAFRASGPGTADTPTSAPNAHTNPVYIEAGGTTWRSAAEARSFLKWIDEFELLLRSRDRFPTPKERQLAQDQLEAARGVYARIIRDARE